MKSIHTLSLALALAITPWSAFADDAHEGHHADAPATMQAPAKPGQPTAKMDAQMRDMRDMHEKMMAAKTPEERKALMDQHRKTMQESMSMMNGMSMMDCMMDKKAARGKPMSPQAMQKQMEMMKMMMQMMMDRIDAVAPAAAN
jgi:hypothetical protein